MPRAVQQTRGEFSAKLPHCGVRGAHWGSCSSSRGLGKDLGCSATILGHLRSGAGRAEACREWECEEEEERGGRSQHSHSHPDAAADAPGSTSVSLSVNQDVL